MVNGSCRVAPPKCLFFSAATQIEKDGYTNRAEGAILSLSQLICQNTAEITDFVTLVYGGE